jgi:hypothetical protein
MLHNARRAAAPSRVCACGLTVCSWGLPPGGGEADSTPTHAALRPPSRSGFPIRKRTAAAQGCCWAPARCRVTPKAMSGHVWGMAGHSCVVQPSQGRAALGSCSSLGRGFAALFRCVGCCFGGRRSEPRSSCRGMKRVQSAPDFCDLMSPAASHAPPSAFRFGSPFDPAADSVGLQISRKSVSFLHLLSRACRSRVLMPKRCVAGRAELALYFMQVYMRAFSPLPVGTGHPRCPVPLNLKRKASKWCTALSKHESIPLKDCEAAQ